MGIDFSLFDLQVAKQTAKGTPATDPEYFLKGRNGTLRPVQEQGELNVGDGQKWGSSLQYVTQVSATGSPRFIVQPKMVGALLYYLLGTDNVTGVADPYTHVLTPGSAGPYLTWWTKLDNKYELFEDVKVGSVTIEGAVGGDSTILSATPELLGLSKPKRKTSGPANPATAEATQFDWFDAEGTWTVDGVVVGIITSFNVEITRGMETRQGESITPFDVFEGRASIVVTFNVLATDFSYYDNILYGSDAPADDTEAAGEIQSGSFDVKFIEQAAPERSFQLTVPALDYRPDDVAAEPNPDGGAGEFVLAGVARGTAPIATATVMNDVATY